MRCVCYDTTHVSQAHTHTFPRARAHAFFPSGGGSRPDAPRVYFAKCGLERIDPDPGAAARMDALFEYGRVGPPTRASMGLKQGRDERIKKPSPHAHRFIPYSLYHGLVTAKQTPGVAHETIIHPTHEYVLTKRLLYTPVATTFNHPHTFPAGRQRDHWVYKVNDRRTAPCPGPNAVDAPARPGGGLPAHPGRARRAAGLCSRIRSGCVAGGLQVCVSM